MQASGLHDQQMEETPQGDQNWEEVCRIKEKSSEGSA